MQNSVKKNRLALEHLAKSALNIKKLSEIGARYLPNTQTKSLSGVGKPSICFDYMVPKRVISGNTASKRSEKAKFKVGSTRFVPSGVFRLRFLEENEPSLIKNSQNGAETEGKSVGKVSKNPFLKSTEKKQPQNPSTIRYWQPKNSDPRLYFPPVIDWIDVFDDVEQPLTITEGEKKALSSCMVANVPCIGLGGVWSFKSTKLGKPLLDDFALLKWKGRQVTIIYDSDLVTNNAVKHAQLELAERLIELGAFVSLGVIIPGSGDPEKMGLDDVIVKYGRKYDDYINIYEFDQCKKLFAMNERLAYIQSSGALYSFEDDLLMNHSQAVNLHFSNEFYDTYNDKGKLSKEPVIKSWLKWPFRRAHSRIEYAPGNPEKLMDGALNLWKGFGVEPSKGSVAPFMALLDHVFAQDKNLKAWFLQWLAYPIQNPGKKNYTCFVLWSLMTGTGKSFIGYIMGDLYGKDNFSCIDQEQLQASFNDWACNKQFILGEEITGVTGRKDQDRIKNMITRESVTINKKYQPTYTVQDCANFFFTSNHPDCFTVERYDRRMTIHEITTGRAAPTVYKRLDKWRREGGVAMLHYYLIHNVNLAAYDPKKESPFSVAKENMIDMSMSDVDAFAAHLLQHPEDILNIGNIASSRDLYTLSELMNFYDPDGSKRTANIALGKALIRSGAFKCSQTCTKSGTKTLYAVRNMSSWSNSEHRVRSEHYDKSVVLLEKARELKNKRRFK